MKLSVNNFDDFSVKITTDATFVVAFGIGALLPPVLSLVIALASLCF
jgi:hypothetical protein